MNKKILVVAAHPDDEILGCAGTVARLVKNGYQAYALILGQGVASRLTEKDERKKGNKTKELKEDMLRADKIIGIKKVFA